MPYFISKEAALSTIPLREHYDVAVIGTGFAGLGMAIELKRSGEDDFVVLERADAVGGTWRDNHYPGCACDVPTPLYSFSFAPNPDWSRLYARWDELRDYLEDCADRFGVRPHIHLGCEVTAATWQADAQRWLLELGDGRTLTARIVIGGFGGLNRPAYPDIEGLRDFAGELFHSADWRHEVPLDGRRVGVIGTGASAIQLIPHVAERAGHLDVFQRTAPWVMPKLDLGFSPRQRGLFRRLPIIQRALRGLVFTITESLAWPITRDQRFLAPLERRALAHLARQVRDPELRARLTPSFRLGCKRILVANNYYPALTRANVDLVTEPIARVTPRGIVTADGVEHELDVLVCSTGFSIAEAFSAIDVRGRDGRTLDATWSEGLQAHRGTAVAGFPNLLVLSGPNTGTGSTSQVYMIESQIRYALRALAHMRARGLATIEAREAAQSQYNRELDARMSRTVWLRGGCDSWYLDERGRNGTLYPGFSSSFRRSLRSLAADEYRFEAPRVLPEPVRELVGAEV